MNAKKVIQRLLVFFIGVPVVVFLASFSWMHHLLLHCAIIAVCGIATNELYDLLKQHSSMLNKKLLIIISMLIPLSATLCSIFSLSTQFITFTFIFVFLVLISCEIFSDRFDKVNENQYFSLSNNRMASSILLVMYCGFLLTFVSRMTTWEFATSYIVVFLLMVFMCDSFAWLFGVLLGKQTRGFFKASPNKSIVGFVFGLVGSMLTGYIGSLIWPDVFSSSRNIIIGFCVGLSAIIGDLVESVMKRSSNCKDSGSIIPGRGGILDSIDSILMAAPVFYFLIEFFYGL